MNRERLHQFEFLSWEKDELFLEIIPRLGGKIRHLRRRGARRNLLLESPEHPLRIPGFGQPFADADTSGWDECFPTVGACLVENGSVSMFPDHGDVWSLPAAWKLDGGRLTTEVPCRSLPCLFRRHLEIEGRTLRATYEVVSQASRAFSIVWSAHPLLAVSPGSRLFLPAEVREVRLEWASDGSLGRPGDMIPWPLASDRRLDEIGPPSGRRAVKLFTPRLSAGWCAFWDKESDEHLVFRFDAATVPHVGLWICEGGWPMDDRPKHHTVALEPCLADCDSLARALAEKTAREVLPGATVSWSMTVTLGRGLPENPGQTGTLS